MQFYRAEPTPRTSWRMAVLMGANTRTYKFALAQALLEKARLGHESVSLDELAMPYAMSLAARVGQFPQVSTVQNLGEQDFLAICTAEAEQSLRNKAPTQPLLDAARRSMPAMVLQKFHNLRGGTSLPHRFYEIGTGKDRNQVLITPHLAAVATNAEHDLDRELDARWSIVEASFTTGIGAALRSHGLRVSDGTLVDPVRRVSVAGVRDSIAGFQHGRCHICHEPLCQLDNQVAVDHVYPFSLMNSGSWTGPNLNEVWNLALAHSSCNSRKSNRLPTQAEVNWLLARNEAIIASPHPLRRALEMLMRGPGRGAATTPELRLNFMRAVDQAATVGQAVPGRCHGSQVSGMSPSPLKTSTATSRSAQKTRWVR